MGISTSTLISYLEPSLPKEVLEELLKEYNQIKIEIFLNNYRLTELSGGRYAECVLRLLEYLDTGSFTEFGVTLNTERIINRIANNNSLPQTLRLLIPRLVRVVLDVRNKRDVAHVGGEVNPNYSDSLFIMHSADWILTEIVRHYHTCTIDQATKLVSAINEVQIPIIDEINGFIRVLDTKLTASDKVLIILYSKKPNDVMENDLRTWVEYQNSTNFRSKVLKELHKKALIHYQNGTCSLTRKGVIHVEKHIPPHIQNV